ncbi:hypothetical protein [Acetomicrobium sp.]|uniref:hypothetical protein n=1 Tax=Acetomicrobium sp. TaxID=1872099 RepID=UPI002871E97C|nr:hypothetical protein [Acetomicrobium sp.]MDR9769511.1 hypothetical protein [Acetomicrobium sp.]
MNFPCWLPKMHPVGSLDRKTYYELYQIFRNDFILSKPLFCGKKVFIFPEMEDGKEKIFWHLTTRDDKKAKQRLPDLRRSERLPWIKPIIDNFLAPEILVWDYEEASKDIHTYFFFEKGDFVVILKKCNKRLYLLTAYWIEYNHQKTKLIKKYENKICGYK